MTVEQTKSVQIGDVVKIQYDRESIVNGMMFMVDDVIRCCFSREPIEVRCIAKNGATLQFSPADCTVVCRC